MAGQNETQPDSVFLRSEITGWIVEKDKAVSDDLAKLEALPDVFDSEAEQLEHVIKLAELKGKKELIEEIAERVVGKTVQKPAQ